MEYFQFDYEDRYEESDYIEYLKYSKYGIRVGIHESQGYAMQEAFSMGLPLLVYDVKSMRNEYYWEKDRVTKKKVALKCSFCDCNQSADLSATSVSTKSPLMGEVVNSMEDMENIWKTILRRVENHVYNPREVEMEVESPKACANRLMKRITIITRKFGVSNI